MTDAVPCKHMAAIALLSVIRPQITPMNIMPIWWKCKQWREQFPLDIHVRQSKHYHQIREGGATSGFHFTFMSQLDSSEQFRAPKEGRMLQIGTGEGNGKG